MNNTLEENHIYLISTSSYWSSTLRDYYATNIEEITDIVEYECQELGMTLDRSSLHIIDDQIKFKADLFETNDYEEYTWELFKIKKMYNKDTYMNRILHVSNKDSVLNIDFSNTENLIKMTIRDYDSKTESNITMNTKVLKTLVKNCNLLLERMEKEH